MPLFWKQIYVLLSTMITVWLFHQNVWSWLSPLSPVLPLLWSMWHLWHNAPISTLVLLTSMWNIIAVLLVDLSSWCYHVDWVQYGGRVLAITHHVLRAAGHVQWANWHIKNIQMKASLILSCASLFSSVSLGLGVFCMPSMGVGC